MTKIPMKARLAGCMVAAGLALAAVFPAGAAPLPEARGDLAVDSGKGEQMAVERVWCGPAGNDWPARYELPLLRRAGQAETAQRLDCSAGAQATACTPR